MYYGYLTLLQLYRRVATVVDLGTATHYSILAQSGISTVPISSIAGNIGVSPAGVGSLTGFDPLVLDPSGQFGELKSLLAHFSSPSCP
jgi:hypothetical protein